MEDHKKLNPLDYNLGSRVKLIEISENHIGILKQRKSRIIMKDGRQIVEIANHILSTNPKIDISLIISGPICSKTKKHLSDSNVGIIVQSLSVP